MINKKIKVVKATIIMRKCEKEISKTKPQKTEKIEIESLEEIRFSLLIS